MKAVWGFRVQGLARVWVKLCVQPTASLGFPVVDPHCSGFKLHLDRKSMFDHRSFVRLRTVLPAQRVHVAI